MGVCYEGDKYKLGVDDLTGFDSDDDDDSDWEEGRRRKARCKGVTGCKSTTMTRTIDRSKRACKGTRGSDDGQGRRSRVKRKGKTRRIDANTAP